MKTPGSALARGRGILLRKEPLKVMAAKERKELERGRICQGIAAHFAIFVFLCGYSFPEVAPI